jgi:acetolactate synthase I/II/III large subunit
LNGAESVLRTLAAGGVSTCFANPGTSEMHLVSALDRVGDVRGVLTLFEGVATGAADGYARMADAPAATLLHLGPGLGNAFANLHNAYKAGVPMVNLVGEHAVMHRPLNAPLTSDIESIARPASHWLATARDARSAAADAAAGVAAARSRGGGISTLILPADAGWDESAGPAAPVAPVPRPPVPEEAVERAAAALRSGADALLLGSPALRDAGLRAAARIAATGVRVLHDTLPTRVARGGARFRPQPLPYISELAIEALAGLDSLVTVGTRAPVGFFAYPGVPSRLSAPDTAVHVLATPEEDAVGALEALADALGATDAAPAEPLERPELPTGELTLDSLTRAVGALLPEGAVVVDESVTASIFFQQQTLSAPEHDYLLLTGGAIGWGLPAATGAAVACPDRPVLALEADGSAMYTIQALWTQAREGLDVTTVIVANRSYAILEFEFTRVGAERGEAARALMDIAGPELGFAGLAEAMGVPGRRVTDVDALTAALREAMSEPGPHVIEAVV